MASQDELIGAEFQRAVRERGLKQSSIARALAKTAPQISRLANGHDRWTLQVAQEIDDILGTSLAGMVTKYAESYELYVSSPITGIREDDLVSEHQKVGRVVATLRNSVESIYWPGDGITHQSQLKDADIATEDNIGVLASSKAFLYLQFHELTGPSSSLIELGFALARGIHTTIIMDEKLRRPFMLRENFEGVAGRISELPDARVRFVPSVERACEILQRDGRKLLGLTPKVPVSPVSDSLF